MPTGPPSGKEGKQTWEAGQARASFFAPLGEVAGARASSVHLRANKAS